MLRFPSVSASLMAIMAIQIFFTVPASADGPVVFHRANEFEPATLDPHLATDTASHTILRDTFEGLTAADGKGGVIPGVAESWDVSDDGTDYIFHLRKDAQWSDGSPVTADDFVYAWQRVIDPATASPYSFILYPVKNAQAVNEGRMDKGELGISAADDHTLHVSLEAPTPYFPELLYQPATYPVVRKNIEQYGDKWTQPGNIISNGPFTLDDIVMQTTISAKKSDRYWDKDNVALDEVVYHTIENAGSGLLRYRAGELDMVNVPQEQLDWARENLPDDLHVYTRLGTYYFGFNQDRPPFKDNPKLRQALSMAIDRNIITEKISRGGQEPAYSIVPPQTARHKSFMPEWAELPRVEQIALAQKLYGEAGYSKDNPLKLNLLYNTGEDQKQNAVAIAAMWKSVLGVETTLQNLEWKVLLSRVKNKDSEVFRMGWSADYNDPFTFLEIFRSNSGNNYTGFSDGQYDTLLDRAAHEPDLEKRTLILHEAEKRFSADNAIMPIFYYSQAILLKPEISGFTPNAVNVVPSRFIRFENH